MLEIICDGFCYLFETFTCRIYCENFYLSKRNGKFKFLIYTAVFLFQYGVSFLRIPGLNVLNFVISYIFLIYICYEAKFKSAVFSGGMLMVMMFLTETMVIHIFAAVRGSEFLEFRKNFLLYLTQASLSKLLFLIVAFLVSKYFRKRDKRSVRDKYAGLLAVLPATTFVILYFLTEFSISYKVTEPYNFALSACSVLLLFANLSVFYIYELFTKSHEQITNLYLEQQKTKMTGEYYELMLDSYNKQKILIHDIKKHLSYIDNAVHNGKNQDAAEYIATILDDFDLNSDMARYEYSGNRMVDVIVSRYAKRCEAEGIELETDIYPCNLSGINDADITALLDNMLENAFEAAEKSAEKQIYLSLNIRNTNYIVINLENSCDQPPKVADGKLLSNKNNVDSHGIGTKSIKRVVNKHNGSFDWSYDSDSRRFKVSAVLDMKIEQEKI